MKYMGIDFGSKRIGIALSDESNAFALPLVVLPNNRNAFSEVQKIIAEKAVTHVVMGESKDYKGHDNAIMPAVRDFKRDIEEKLGIAVVYEPEFMTSHQAERFQGKHDMLDASAAAIILQSYLDRKL